MCCVWYCAVCVTSVISKSIPASDSTCRAAHSGTTPVEDFVYWAYTWAGPPADSGPVIKCEANYPKRLSISIRMSQDFWWTNDCWTLHYNAMLIWLFLVWTFTVLTAQCKESGMKFDVLTINDMLQTCQNNELDWVFFFFSFITKCNNVH